MKPRKNDLLEALDAIRDILCTAERHIGGVVHDDEMWSKDHCRQCEEVYWLARLIGEAIEWTKYWKQPEFDQKLAYRAKEPATGCCRNDTGQCCRNDTEGAGNQ